MASQTAVEKTLALLMENWPKEHSDLSAEIFNQVLKDVTNPDLEEAVYFFLQSDEKFQPTVGMIHTRAREVAADRYVLERMKKGGGPTKHDHPESQPRYKCLICKDVGMVHVVNPSLVRRYAKWRAEKTDETLRAWWTREYASRNYGPTDLMVCCSCQGLRATNFRREMDEFKTNGYREVGQRERKVKIFSPPACGAYHYHKADMPIMRGVESVEDVTEDWLAKGGTR